MNLNQSLHPFQWEASQHPNYLLKHRRVSRLCWHLQSSPHNHTATSTEIRLCFSNTILSHRHSQDLLRQNYARAHASSASLHVSSGNVLIAHSSNTDFQYICKTQQHRLAAGGRSDSFPLLSKTVHTFQHHFPSQASLSHHIFPSSGFQVPITTSRWDGAHLLHCSHGFLVRMPGDALNFAP